MPSDVLLMFNGDKLIPILQDTENEEKNLSNCYLAGCFWVAQFSLLVKENHLIGMVYSLDEQYFDVVSSWIKNWKSPYLQLKNSELVNYYEGRYITKYVVEIYFILDEPDRYEGLAMIEDRWWYLQDNIHDQYGWYIENIDPEIAIPNLFAVGLADPAEIAKEWDLQWNSKGIAFLKVL